MDPGRLRSLVPDRLLARYAVYCQRSSQRGEASPSTHGVRFFAGKAVGVLTNVPGPHDAGGRAGRGHRRLGAVQRPPGDHRLHFSYAGEVRFGFGTDRGLIPDPEVLVDALAAEFAEAAQRA